MRELVKDKTNRKLGKHQHTCRLCGAKGMFDSWLVREMMQDNQEEFEYFECAVCGCLQIAKIPPELGKYYGKDYYSFAQEELPDFCYKTPVKRKDRILDVGCGSGSWLFRKALSGYGNLYGADPFLERDLHYGDRVWIRKSTIHEITEDAFFDEIRMRDAFEHMTDPVETLQSVVRLLKPEGVFAMDIPVYPNIAFEMFGAHWFQIDAPRHIFLHSKKSLEYLEEKSGLRIIKMEYDADYSQILRSFFYSMGVPFYEQTSEMISRYFTEEDKRSMMKATYDSNRTGCSDHARVYWMRQGADESLWEKAYEYAKVNEETKEIM